MFKVVILVSLLLRLSPINGFDKDVFLSRCRKRSCLRCEDITITRTDDELFKTTEFNISSELCIIFENGNLGEINGDFFKQFPETKKITFQFLNMSLKSSETVVLNKDIEFLEIRGCNVTDNLNSNTLHSIPGLRVLEIAENNLEHKILEEAFLSSSSDLEIVWLRDERSHYWRNEPSENLKMELNSNVLANMVKLDTLRIEIRDLSRIPENFFKNNQKLKFLEIKGPLETFPDELPPSLTDLRFEFTKFKKLTRSNLESLKNLTCLWIRNSDLEKVDLDAFEGVLQLEELVLDFNKVWGLHSKHLAKLRLKEYSLQTIVR